MTPREEPALGRYARGLRRRWRLLVGIPVHAGLLALATVAFAGNPTPAPAERPQPTWTAATVLMAAETLQVDLSTVVSLATLGDVPTRAAEALDMPRDDLLAVVGVVEGASPPTSGDGSGGERTGTSGGTAASGSGDQRGTSSDLLTVTATAPSEERAEEIADTLAAELIVWTVEDAEEQAQAERDQRAAEIERLRVELEALEAAAETEDPDPAPATPTEPTRDGAAPDTGVSGDRSGRTGGTADGTAYDVKLQEYARLLAEQETAADAASTTPGLTILEPAAAVREARPTPETSVLPSGRRARVLGAVVLAALGALALALVLDRLDGRLYTVDDVRRHLPIRVVATIPRRSRREQRSGTTEDRATEAFRMLAAKLALPGPSGAARARTLLLVGPTRRTGVSFVASRLGAELAGLGVQTLVLDCDLRGTSSDPPTADPGPDLAGLLQGSPDGEAVFAGLDSGWLASGLVVMPPGQAEGNRAALLGSDRMARALDEVSDRAGMVLLDAPPLLEVSDAATLVPRADLVLLVLRGGRTTGVEAAEVSELLHALGARDVAIVLNAAEGAVRGHPTVSWARPWARSGQGGKPPLVRQSVDA